MTSLKSKVESQLNHFGKQCQLPFVIIAILTAVIYSCFIIFFGDDPHHQSRLDREWFSWLTSLGLMVLYIAGYFRLKAENKFPFRALILWTVFIVILNVMITPFHSTDLYGYINRGWQQVGYGLNPYTSVVDDIPNWQSDPMITDHWVNNPCPYGFLFAQIAKWLCVFGGGNLGLTILLFKAANGLVHLTTIGFIWLGLKALNRQRPEIECYLLGWNPLLLLHQIANGHNDIWMGAFIALAGLFMVLKRPLWILPALTAGVFIKYAAIVMVPVAIIFMALEFGWLALLSGLILSIGLFGLMGWPYFVPLDQVPLNKFTQNATISHHSLHSVLFKFWKEITKLILPLMDTRPLVKQLLKYSLWGSYGFFIISQSWQWLKKKNGQSSEDFIQNTLSLMAFILLVGLIVATSKFYPWYLGAVIPVAFLLKRGNIIRQLIITLTMTELLAFTFLGQAHLLNYLLLVAVPLMVFAVHQVKQNTKPILKVN